MFDMREEQIQNKDLVLLARKRILKSKSFGESSENKEVTAIQCLFAVEDKSVKGKYKLITTGQEVTTNNNILIDSNYKFVAKGKDIENALKQQRVRMAMLMGMEHANPMTELFKVLNNSPCLVNNKLIALVEKELELGMVVNAQLSNIRSPKPESQPEM